MGSHCIDSNVFTPPGMREANLFITVQEAAKIVRGIKEAWGGRWPKEPMPYRGPAVLVVSAFSTLSAS